MCIRDRNKYGTVGCVAIDAYGNIVAGTSTGGMTNKKWGRIGDSPIIGAGTYANNNTCAISATGWGEFFIRSVVAHDISALMEYKGLSIQEASRIVIHEKVATLGGDGGIVGIDNQGNVAMEMNTPGMYRAHIDNVGNLFLLFMVSFSIMFISVFVFREIPTFFLKLLICLIDFAKLSVASGCIVIISAPASAKSFIYLWTGEIIK